MIEHPRRLHHGQTGRGSVNTVQRQGDVIIRPAGPWSPAVHNLLQHLEGAGFSFSPRVVGFDTVHEKEHLSYLHGEVAMRPWPECLLTCAGIEQIGAMLRRYHQVVATYRPSTQSRWRDPDAVWNDGMIVRHGDLGPWNMVWESGKLVGLIDWDFAEPGHPLDDLAQVAWYCVPLSPKERCRDAGVDLREIGNRLKCLCDSYGIDPEQVLEALFHWERREMERTRRLAARGIEPWVEFRNRGDLERMTNELEWLCNVTQSTQPGTRLKALISAGIM